MKRVYLGDFDSWSDVINSFHGPEDMEEPEYVFAIYTQGNWDGDAEVIFKKDGEFYGVFGSHCSCYGLENQWYVEGPWSKEEVKRFVRAEEFDEWLEKENT